MKQLKRVQVLYFLLMIAIVGGIIAHAILYSDLVSFLTSLQGQRSRKFFLNWLLLQFIPIFQLLLLK
jgi:hypothetical protein